MIEINNEQTIFEITEDITQMIGKAVESTAEHEGFWKPFEVCVMITDNNGIRELNHMHRNIDKATDVLSFPMLLYKNGIRLDEEQEDDINPETGNVILGDIVLSLEKIHEQAEEFGHGFDREAGYLVVHSMLHLLGYDHENSSDRGIMRSKEEEILKQMGLQR